MQGRPLSVLSNQNWQAGDSGTEPQSHPGSVVEMMTEAGKGRQTRTFKIYTYI